MSNLVTSLSDLNIYSHITLRQSYYLSLNYYKHVCQTKYLDIIQPRIKFLILFYIVVNIKQSKPFNTILYKKLICMHNFLDKMEGIGTAEGLEESTKTILNVLNNSTNILLICADQGLGLPSRSA